MKIHTIGDSIWKTITAIITIRTASAVHGTGADITRLGTHGTSLHGDTADGMTDGITEAGTVHIITAATTGDGTTLGTGAVIGDGTTLGTARITIHTTADGMADGIHIGVITTITAMVPDTSEMWTTIRMYGMDQDTRQARKEYSEAVHRSEEASETEAQ